MDTKKTDDKKVSNNRKEMMEEMTLNQDKLISLRLSHGISPECLFENFPGEYLGTPKNKNMKV